MRTGAGGNALPKRREQELLTKWAPVRIVAIDEMSMVDTQLLHQIHARLQLVKGSTDDFGGIHIVLSGDLTQLPPIVRQPLYMPSKKVRPGGVVENDGHCLYLLFKNVVMLERNMRAAVDPEWTDILSRMRLGVSTSADRAFLRGLSGSRERLQVVSEEVAAAAASTSAAGGVDDTPLSPLCPVIVATNRERYDVIWSVVQATAERNRDPRRRPVIIPAVYNRLFHDGKFGADPQRKPPG